MKFQVWAALGRQVPTIKLGMSPLKMLAQACLAAMAALVRRRIYVLGHYSAAEQTLCQRTWGSNIISCQTSYIVNIKNLNLSIL